MTSELFAFDLYSSKTEAGSFVPKPSTASSDSTSHFSLDLSDDALWYTTQLPTAPMGYVDNFVADYGQLRDDINSNHLALTSQANRCRLTKLAKLKRKCHKLIAAHNGLVTNEAKVLLHQYYHMFAVHAHAFETTANQRRCLNKGYTQLKDLPTAINTCPDYVSDNDSFHPNEEDIDLSPMKKKGEFFFFFFFFFSAVLLLI